MKRPHYPNLQPSDGLFASLKDAAAGRYTERELDAMEATHSDNEASENPSVRVQSSENPTLRHACNASDAFSTKMHSCSKGFDASKRIDVGTMEEWTAGQLFDRVVKVGRGLIKTAHLDIWKERIMNCPELVLWAVTRAAKTAKSNPAGRLAWGPLQRVSLLRCRRWFGSSQ